MIKKFTFILTLTCSLCFHGATEAKTDAGAVVSVKVWPHHRGGFVTYKYTVTNSSLQAIDSMTIGFYPLDTSDGRGAEITVAPLTQSKSFWLSPEKTTSPNGWGAAIRYPDESSKLMIEWIEGNKEHVTHPSEAGVQGMPTIVNPPNLLPVGTTWDTFSVTVQKEDPAYVNGHATFFLDGKLVTVPIKKGDSTPPTVSASLQQITHPNPVFSTLKFSVSALDNYDSAPPIILESVKSDQPLGKGDLSAQVGSDVRLATVRNVKGRTYFITFSATDASGNVGRKTLSYASP
ncbi:MAG: hypothetical protein H7224_03445 [Polaromonas sp.]|nr:hypothetical protein [Polaromonas sp.]